MRVPLILRRPFARAENDRELVETRLNRTLEAHELANMLDAVGEFRAAQQRLERATLPAAARAAGNRVCNALLFGRHALFREPREALGRHGVSFSYGIVAIMPPSTTISVAVMKRASSEARNRTACATSHASPI
jgi:hypothetical protein